VNGAAGSGANAVPRQQPAAQSTAEDLSNQEERVRDASPSSRSLVVSQIELDKLVDTKVAAAQKKLEAGIADRIGKELREQLTTEWKQKMDLEEEKTETLKLRAITAENAVKEREAELEKEKRRADAEASQHEAQLVVRDQMAEELREVTRGDALRIASLEAQLATQQGRAEALEQSYAAELDASSKAAAEARQQISGLNAELGDLRRGAGEEKQRREAEVEKASHQHVSDKKGESSKLLLRVLSTKLRGTVASTLGRWKLFILNSEEEKRRSEVAHAHAVAMATAARDSQAEIARLSAAATMQRLELEQQVRQLQIAVEQMNLSLVKVAKPGAGSPLFDRGVALKRCDFG